MVATVAALATLLGPVAAPQASPQSPVPQAAAAGAELRVFLLTMGPGRSVYERYGHNAIWIHHDVTGVDLVYNYGTFDFAAPGFVTNFVRGRPQYWLGVANIGQTLDSYLRDRRGVAAQELALLPSQRLALAVALADNALPQNRRYTYDYFLDNCSTRVRDALDRVLGGALRAATEGRPAEGSFRVHTQRSLANDVLMYTGIMLGQGPRTDRAIDQWAEMFLPARSRSACAKSGADTRAVVPCGREDTSYVRQSRERRAPRWGRGFQITGYCGVMAVLIAMSLCGRDGGSRASGRHGW